MGLASGSEVLPTIPGALIQRSVRVSLPCVRTPGLRIAAAASWRNPREPLWPLRAPRRALAVAGSVTVTGGGESAAVVQGIPCRSAGRGHGPSLVSTFGGNGNNGTLDISVCVDGRRLRKAAGSAVAVTIANRPISASTRPEARRLLANPIRRMGEAQPLVSVRHGRFLEIIPQSILVLLWTGRGTCVVQGQGIRSLAPFGVAAVEVRWISG